MNSQIETWRVQQFAANVLHTSQQKGSRLAPLVRKETFKGKAEFFDRLGQATAQKKTGRNTDTPNLDIAHSRRMLVTAMYEWATLVDRKDKLQNIHSPESEYAIAARNALGRSMDDILLAAAFAAASTGESGSSSTTLGNAQKVAAVKSSALDYLNIAAIRKAKFKFDAAEVEGQRYITYRGADLEALLATTEITSADYNNVRALVRGEIMEFLGFQFIHSERNPLATTYDDDTFKWDSTTGLYSSGGTAVAATDVALCAFVGDGLILGMNEGIVAKIEPRADKSYDNQVYTSMDLGGVRMEEVKVVQIVVKA